MHEELEADGLTVVTVAFDTDIEAARPFHEAATPTHPALIDRALGMAGDFGITNVPFGIWIDETGTIVRPPEVAFSGRQGTGGRERTSDTNTSEGSTTADAERPRPPRVEVPPERQATFQKMLGNIGDTSRYSAAVRDWVANGAASSWVLTPDEVIKRSRPRPIEFSLAAAEFDLGQHLHRAGFPLDAVPHFEAAHRLDPENWSYPRQALSLVDPAVGQHYERDLLTELEVVGAETFYPPLDM